MATVYDAIELLSVNLHEQIRMLTGARGWGCKAHPFLICPRPMEFKSYTGTSIHLPGGMGASFIPRSEPMGETWIIDVRRSDGKIPAKAQGGLMLMKSQGAADKDGIGWSLRSPSGPLTDAALSEILDDLAS
jgi:hypothetical protein